MLNVTRMFTADDDKMPLIDQLVRASPNNRSERVHSHEAGHSADPEPETEPENIYSTLLEPLYRIEADMDQHGVPGGRIIYTSGHFGDIALTLENPTDPVEQNRFGQYIWNAAIVMAITIEAGSIEGIWRDRMGFDVKGLKVLELGAGAGLVGIIAALSGARQIDITDAHNANHLANIRSNVNNALAGRCPEAFEKTRVHEHTWGRIHDDFCDAFNCTYDVVLLSDCLWSSQEHAGLITSIDLFLKSTTYSKVFIVAGFHTGREVVHEFFEKCAHNHLKKERIWEQETKGSKRVWDPNRVESACERRRWVVMAELRRHDGRYEEIMTAESLAGHVLPATMPNGLPYAAGFIPNGPAPAVRIPSPPSTFYLPRALAYGEDEEEEEGQTVETGLQWHTNGGTEDIMWIGDDY